MLFFSSIPASYLPEIQRIERVSNPHVWTADNIQDSYCQFSHLGAFFGNELLAFVMYQVIIDESEIIHLVCDKAHQGNGYSRALLVALREKLAKQSVEKLFLEVRDDNLIAKKIYASMGFENVGRRANYYNDRHDALVQRLLI